MEKIILSPPFSNLKILSPPKATRVLGTYTLERRRGLWRVLTTLKKIEGGWVNNVGLRNGGIETAPNSKNIISISVFDQSEWEPIITELKKKDNILGVEVNISCPNAQVKSIPSESLSELKECFEHVIVKTPHFASLCFYLRLIDLGADTLHISNTRPSERGGISGASLVLRNLKKIKEVKSFRPHVKVIGGGGIYDLETLLRYEDAGADHLSLSTILLSPLKARKIVNQYYERSNT